MNAVHAHSDAEPHGHDPAEVDRHVRAAKIVFGTLILLTFVTVGAFYLKLPIHLAIALALVIATFKASLVACYFMHLISERKLIFSVLGLTFGFFFVLLLVPVTTSIKDHVGHLIVVPHHAAAADEHHAEHHAE